MRVYRKLIFFFAPVPLLALISFGVRSASEATSDQLRRANGNFASSCLLAVFIALVGIN